MQIQNERERERCRPIVPWMKAVGGGGGSYITAAGVHAHVLVRTPSHPVSAGEKKALSEESLNP